MEQWLSQPGCGPRKEINVPPRLFVFIVYVYVHAYPCLYKYMVIQPFKWM